MYKIIADMHTHSMGSTHAYSTISEMFTAAKEKGLYALAITEHANLMPGSPGPMYLACLNSTIPRTYKGVLAVMGVEGNIVDFDGNIDVSEWDLNRLDWIVASIHNIPFEGFNLKNPDIEKSTNLYLKVAENPRVNVIGHSGDPNFKYDYEKVIPVFGEKGKLVEINAHSFEVRKQNIENCKEIALTCKKYGVPIIVNSDAHIDLDVANLSKALKMLEEIDFPEELIVNSSQERLTDYLRKYTPFFTRERPGDVSASSSIY